MTAHNPRPPNWLIIQLAITAVVSLVLGGIVGATSFYHIRSYDRAFTNYMHNPTPVNETAFNAESQKIQHMRNVDSLKAALLCFCFFNFVVGVATKKARLAALSLFAGCSTFLILVGIPSFPIDWRCCAYYGPGFEDGLSEATLQITALCAWAVALALLGVSVIHYRARNSSLGDASN